jgi:hypothetical protein
MSATTEIHTRVARVLVETLNADKEDVTPAATLQGDLGAESIDCSAWSRSSISGFRRTSYSPIQSCRATPRSCRMAG